MSRKLSPLSMAVFAILCVGMSLPARDALGQANTSEAQAGVRKTWLSISDYVERPEGCAAPAVGSKSSGILNFTAANGRSVARYLDHPIARFTKTKLSTADANLTEPLALLSAYVARPDGHPDPAFGVQPRDMVILTTGDGRIVVTITDFSADPEGIIYPYPASVRIGPTQ